MSPTTCECGRFPGHAALTSEQISRYEQDGFLMFDPILGTAEVQRLSRHIDQVLAALPRERK